MSSTITAWVWVPLCHPHVCIIYLILSRHWYSTNRQSSTVCSCFHPLNAWWGLCHFDVYVRWHLKLQKSDPTSSKNAVLAGWTVPIILKNRGEVRGGGKGEYHSLIFTVMHWKHYTSSFPPWPTGSWQFWTSSTTDNKTSGSPRCIFYTQSKVTQSSILLLYPTYIWEKKKLLQMCGAFLPHKIGHSRQKFISRACHDFLFVMSPHWATAHQVKEVWLLHLTPCTHDMRQARTHAWQILCSINLVRTSVEEEARWFIY